MPLVKKKLVSFWKGPEVDGITQSLIGDYLMCRERFRIKVIEGLGRIQQFEHRIEYGNMWHLCEEKFLGGDDWEASLLAFSLALAGTYPLQQQEVEKWYQVCKVQFPVYIQYWKDYAKEQNIIPVMQEHKFKVLYELPSGRHVNLRGMWDAINLMSKKQFQGLYLQENKAKGEINEEGIARQVSFDLQTMTYLVALREFIDNCENEKEEWEKVGNSDKKLKGIMYNVIRRPLSGGKGSIRPHQATKKKEAETLPHFYDRLRDDYLLDDPGYFFMRWKIDITERDIDRFENETLIPILENICDDYEWWDWCYTRGNTGQFDFTERHEQFPLHQNRHFHYPFGVYHTLNEGRQHDLDEYLLTGSNTGLQKIDSLFRELEN